jgi:DNA-binding response OmpR family regulator
MKTNNAKIGHRESGRSLHDHVKVFLRHWGENLGEGKPWRVHHAAALYEDLEALCAMAERENAAEIVEPALELAIYLCSFVDGDNAPNAAQRQGLEQLIGLLATGVAGASRGQVMSAGAASRQVFYLRSDERELAGLAPRLGQGGCIVRPFHTRQLLLLAFDEITPDILIVDEGFIVDVHAITAAALRKRAAHRDPPLCIVLADATDRTRTLFAQRAGADAVVTERDPIALVTLVDKLLAQRRALDFRVLIVEDDRSQAKYCDSILRHCGMSTCICEDASRVPAMLNEFKPDLVLLDMYLPESNGIEIAQQIREQQRHAFLPIVFLTGEHDQNLRFDAIRVGADDFITKPIKPRHLVTAVESRIKRARELHTGHPEQRVERRGILSSRDAMTREVQRVAHEGRERCPALACIAVDNMDKMAQGMGFVAAGALPQQIAAALAVELSDQRALCAWGEMRFLALLQTSDELTLRETLEDVRRKLDARLWLSDESPVRLRFSLGCVRLPAEVGRIEELIERSRALCVRAQQAGGAHCEFDLRSPGEQDDDPRRRLLRAVLRAPNLHGMGRLDFQPLLPLSGQIKGQYEARMELIPEKFARSLHLKRSDYLPLARELNMAGQADRQCLRAMLERLRDGRPDKYALRLHLPVCVETVFDGAFAPWLAAELRGHQVSGGAFVLVLTAVELHARLA